MLSAFIPVTLPLRSNGLSVKNSIDNRPSPTTLNSSTRREAPRMVSVPILASELLAVTALGATTYLFLTRSGAQPPVETDTSPTNSGGIIGLQSMNRPLQPTDNLASETAPPPAAPLEIDTVGVDINDFLDESDARSSALQRTERVNEEFQWALSSLLDLPDCDAVAIIGSKNNIVASSGSLINDVTDAGPISARVTGGGSIEFDNVTDNSDFPFLATTVRSYAVLPVAESGAALVLASSQIDFLGEKELRMATAVCNRLASYSFVSPSGAKKA